MRHDVDDEPVIRKAEVGLIDAEQLTDRAPRAVGADQVTGRGGFLAILVGELQGHPPGLLRQPDQRTAPPHPHARQGL